MEDMLEELGVMMDDSGDLVSAECTLTTDPLYGWESIKRLNEDKRWDLAEKVTFATRLM